MKFFLVPLSYLLYMIVTIRISAAFWFLIRCVIKPQFLNQLIRFYIKVPFFISLTWSVNFKHFRTSKGLIKLIHNWAWRFFSLNHTNMGLFKFEILFFLRNLDCIINKGVKKLLFDKFNAGIYSLQTFEAFGLALDKIKVD